MKEFVARSQRRQAVAAKAENHFGHLGKIWFFAALTILIAFSFMSVANARGAPDSFADLAERLLPAVVNISTTQVVKQRQQQKREVPMPQFPPGSPFEDFFKDFFDRQERGEGGDEMASRVPAGQRPLAPASLLIQPVLSLQTIMSLPKQMKLRLS